MTTGLCRVGLKRDHRDPDVQRRIAGLRREIRASGSSDVLTMTASSVGNAAIAAAAWGESRRIIFPPSTQPAMLDELLAGRSALVTSGEPDEAGIGDFDDIAEPAADAIVAEFYTSGSTGRPTAVLKSAAQLFGEARHLIEHFELSGDDVLLSGAPAHHLYGFLFSALIPMLTGCRVVDATPLHARSVARLAREHGATVFVSTPAQLAALAGLEAPPAFRQVFSSGAPLPAAIGARLASQGLRVTEIFGSTETGGIAWRTAETAPLWTPFGPVHCEADDDGVLLLRSPFAGSPALVRTHDRIEPIGAQFRHLGRRDDVVKVGSKRVSKRAIHDRLLEHDAVDAVATGEETDAAGQIQRLHTFVVPKREVSPAELRQHLGAWFDAVAIPRLHLVDTLPLTPMGKVSRDALQRLIAEATGEIAFAAPVGPSARPGADEWRVRAWVPTSCRYFDGHFDGFPILPGVVQLHTIVQAQIARIWPELTAPSRVLRLKFTAPIRPGHALELGLKRAGDTVTFTLTGAEKGHCSGRFVYS